MVRHFVWIKVVTLGISLGMFLPFIPGDYDASALSVSMTAQLFGMAGLLVVPVGIAWLVYEIVMKEKVNGRHSTVTYRFALTALVISVFIALVTSLGGFVTRSFSLTIITLMLCGYAIVKFFIRIRKMKKEESSSFNPTPLYLIVIPIALVLIRFMFIIPATEFSRNLAIKHSEPLIRDIESYHAKNGHYPISLLSLWEDYKPGVIGIDRYQYEQNGAAYNLFFRQFSYPFGVEEIVMYNKLDAQNMSSHNQDLLHFTGESLNAQRGYFGVYDLPTPHWKYFWFD